MTLTLTYITRDHIVQAADRLLTKGGTEFDPSANKIVLLSAKDGIGSIVYSGTAYIGEQPTDDWIANTLRDAISARSGLGLRLGSAMAVLRNAMSNACPRIATKTQSFELSIGLAGWRTTGHRPVVFGLQSRARNEPPYSGERTNRPSEPLFALPEFSRHRDEVRNLQDRLQETSDHGEVARLLRETIANISNVNPLVGPNVQYVVVPRKTDEAIEIHYVPDHDNPSFNNDVSQHPAAYTPWIVGSSGAFSPSVVAGEDLGLGLDERWFSFHAPPAIQRGGWKLMSAYSSMRRPNLEGVREEPRAPSLLPLAPEPRAGFQWINGQYEPIPPRDGEESAR